MSIFTKTDEYTQKPPRNTFDGSFANNLTLKAGQITPCFLKEVVPGDSFKIDAKLGFNFMPMTFPVQTDMQCNLHFFYVRNRALWKGWENFITKTENLEGDSTPPYIMLNSGNRHMFDTGEIGDYLGVPTVFYGSENEKKVVAVSQKALPSITQGFYLHTPDYSIESGSDYYALFYGTFSDSVGTAKTLTRVLTSLATDSEELTYGSIHKHLKNTIVPSIQDGVNGFSPIMVGLLPTNITSFPVLSSGSIVNTIKTTSSPNQKRVIQCIFDVDKQEVVAHLIQTFNESTFVSADSTFNFVNSETPQFVIPSALEIHNYLYFAFTLNNVPQSEQFPVSNASYNVTAIFDARLGIPNSKRELFDLPFISSALGPNGEQGEIRISAMPFRAVEACYNAFYRDDRNNPLMINGKPYYNTWVQNRNGGADTGLYKLYRKNWQPDVFTTAVQSPQQGIMPLVGVTATGQMTFSDEAGKTYYLQAEFGEDGQTITGISSYSSDMPAGTLRSMVDTISTGISINDFRNVNALQRWLETNMRKGLRYKDQIEAHFGTSPTYSELQMPEFIGGMSRRVSMSAIEQTVDTLNPANGTGNALGTLGGRASVVGNDGSPITNYCDEHGWIIGFVTITPSPVYSQQLNKQLLKHNLLDYYFPEFAHIGYQPILNEELAPLQCKSGQQPNGNGLKDVFGYNRAWYEYLENVDEVHGDFRTSLRNFLIQRIFNGVPKLGEEFLTVSDREVNQVFAVNDDSDKIFGQIYFDVKMKRPFPRLGIPKLETE